MTIAEKGRADTVVGFDLALIERARKGDSRAFERLYRDHVGRVHGLCLRMTRNPDLAADCVQDTFIKAWKALPRFEARSSFSAWLHRIAVNTVLEKRRGPANSELVVEDPTAYEEPVLTFDTPVEESELEAAIQSLPRGAQVAVFARGSFHPYVSWYHVRMRRHSAVVTPSRPSVAAPYSCVKTRACCSHGGAPNPGGSSPASTRVWR